MEIHPGHPSTNTNTMLHFIEEAKNAHADIILFPEMAIPGYLLGDTWEQDAFLRDCEACAADIIAASDDIAIIFGNVAVDWRKKNNDGRPRKYNACFLANKGKLLHPEAMPYPFVIKTLMPNYREFDTPFLQPAEACAGTRHNPRQPDLSRVLENQRPPLEHRLPALRRWLERQL